MRRQDFDRDDAIDAHFVRAIDLAMPPAPRTGRISYGPKRVPTTSAMGRFPAARSRCSGPRWNGKRWKGKRTMNGTISRVLSDKGFGFIKGDDGQEYFMHRSAGRDGSVFEQLRDGQPVIFDASRGDKGLRAENVRLV